MKFDLYNQKGKKLTKQIIADDSIFSAEINETLLRTAVHVFLSNQRQSNADVKTRSEVRGGGAKPWAQKGTGRARQGSIRSPIWKGGGVTFGPSNERDYKKKLNRKMIKESLRSAFSLKAKEKSLVFVDKIDFLKEKFTNTISVMINSLKLSGSTLIIHTGKDKNVYLGSRNIPNIFSLPVNEINTYNIIKSKNIIIIEDALEMIKDFWGNIEKKEIKSKKVKNVENKKVKKTKKITKKK